MMMTMTATTILAERRPPQRRVHDDDLLIYIIGQSKSAFKPESLNYCYIVQESVKGLTSYFTNHLEMLSSLCT